MEKEKKKVSWAKTLKFLLKAGIAAGIVAVLVSRDIADLEKSLETFDYSWLIPAALCYLFHMLVCAFRWQKLTGVLKLGLTPFEAVSLTMQSYFFSLVMPGGAIGGDLVKMGVLSARSQSASRLEGAFTILMDRIIGMIALFILTLVIAIPAVPVLMKVKVPDFVLTDGMKTVCIAALFALCIAGLGASVVMFFHRRLEKMPVIGLIMHKADRITHGMVSRMETAMDIYRSHISVVIKAVLVSIPFVHLMTVVTFFFVAKGLKVDNANLFVMVAAVTIGNIAGLIPLSPGGIGIRDVTVISILAAGGMAAGEAKAVQLLYTVLMVFCHLTGGIFFLMSPRKEIKK